MTWNYVPKPTDDSWNDVAKPSESSVASFTEDAQPLGVLIAITVPSFGSSVISGWTDIPKPTDATWTLVAKPTD